MTIDRQRVWQSWLPLLALLAVVSCGTPAIQPVARFGPLAIDGSLDFDPSGGVVSPRLDTGDLGLDDDDDDLVFQPRLDVDWDGFHVFAEGFAADYSGNGFATADIRLGPNEITANTPVHSSADLGLYTGGFAVDVLPFDFVDLGLGLGVGLVDYDVDIDSRTGPARVSADDQLGFGFLVGRGAVEFWRVGVNVLASGLSLEFGGDDFTYLDLDAMATFRLFEVAELLQFHLGAGYRYVSVDYEFSDGGGDVDVDVDLDGPYGVVKASLTF